MEEIKAGDIRIGNKLFYTIQNKKKIGTVIIIDSVNQSVMFDEDFDVYIKLEDCSSIPLTEDILLKAGFRKHKMSGYDTHFIYSLFIGGETIGITAIYNADFSIMLHGVARGVKYLHSLQNIIKIITGNELEINL